MNSQFKIDKVKRVHVIGPGSITFQMQIFSSRRYFHFYIIYVFQYVFFSSRRVHYLHVDSLSIFYSIQFYMFTFIQRFFFWFCICLCDSSIQIIYAKALIHSINVVTKTSIFFFLLRICIWTRWKYPQSITTNEISFSLHVENKMCV